MLQHTAARVADRDRFLAAYRRVQSSVYREEVERLIAGRLTVSEVPPKKWTAFCATVQATDELLATAEGADAELLSGYRHLSGAAAAGTLGAPAELQDTTEVVYP